MVGVLESKAEWNSLEIWAMYSLEREPSSMLRVLETERMVSSKREAVLFLMELDRIFWAIDILSI